VKVYARNGNLLHLGKVGENGATTVIFDVADWLKEFGDSGTFGLLIEQNDNTYIIGQEVGNTEAIIIFDDET
jgi:hypothetical protein